MYLIARARTLTTSLALAVWAAQRPALFLLSSPRTSILHHGEWAWWINDDDKYHALFRPGLSQTLRCHTKRQVKAGSQCSHKEFQVVLAVQVGLEVWRNPRTGTFLASETELRASGDTSQWIDRYLIASGHSLPPQWSWNLLSWCPPGLHSLLIPRRVYRDSAGKGPCSSIYSKGFVFLLSQQEPVGFLLVSLKYIWWSGI